MYIVAKWTFWVKYSIWRNISSLCPRYF